MSRSEGEGGRRFRERDLGGGDNVEEGRSGMNQKRTKEMSSAFCVFLGRVWQRTVCLVDGRDAAAEEAFKMIVGR